MAANYEDAFDAKSHLAEGMGWSLDDSRAKELEHAICTLFQCVEKSMTDGTLNPFKGDYIKWLEGLGMISPRQTIGNTNAQK